LEAAEAVLLATDEPADEAATVAEEVMDVAAVWRLANCEEMDEALAPVAVARTELKELMDEPTPLRALLSLEAMEERTELPWERTELMTEAPEERALVCPLTTADEAEAAELDWAEATAARAATETIE
jgi:hypothetical protein